MDYLNIPDEMKSLPNWVLWRKEYRNNKETKVPYSVNGVRASSTNPGTWGNFPDVLQGLTNQYNGIGFMLTLETGIIFIDIDHCLLNGHYDERAIDILNAFEADTYCEISQSGEGLHIFAYGTIPRNFKNSQNGVEMYAEKRYCAMTGNRCFSDAPYITYNQLAIDYVFQKYKTTDVKQTAPVTEHILSLSDMDIVTKAQQDAKFSMLWDGNWSLYNSQSEADLALCAKLAFWTDGDKKRIDTLFRSSGLYRNKWNRPDYRERTINQACACCRITLSEWISRKEVSKLDRYSRSVW